MDLHEFMCRLVSFYVLFSFINLFCYVDRASGVGSEGQSMRVRKFARIC